MSTVNRATPVESASDTATSIPDITLTAATATQLLVAAAITPVDMPCRTVIVTSDPENTGGAYIRLGDSTVGPTVGQKLAAGQSYSYTIANARDVWLYTDGSDQVVQATVFA